GTPGAQAPPAGAEGGARARAVRGRAEGDGRRPDDVHPPRVEDLGGASARHLLGEDDLLVQAGVAPAVLARPLDGDPSRSGELALPGALEAPTLDVVLRRTRARDVRREPGAELVTERLLGGGEARLEHRLRAEYSKACAAGKEAFASGGLARYGPGMDELRFPNDGGCFGCSPSNPAGLQLAFRRDDDGIVTRYAIPERFHGAPGI